MTRYGWSWHHVGTRGVVYGNGCSAFRGNGPWRTHDRSGRTCKTTSGPDQLIGTNPVYRRVARHGPFRHFSCEYARLLRSDGRLRRHRDPVPWASRHHWPVGSGRFHPGQIHHHFFVSVRHGLRHTDEPRGSQGRSVSQFLPATPARARIIWTDPRHFHLGRRCAPYLRVLGSHFAVVSQSPAENAALVGGKS